MVYVDSSGVTHVSYEEAASGYAAKTTASRNAIGEVVGTDIGSRYVRQQEAEKTEQQQQQQNTVIPYYTPSPMAADYNKVTSPTIPAQTIQQRTVAEASFIPSSLPEKSTAFLSRSWEAMKQGFSAGEGKEYSLSGLQAPRSQNTYTNSFFNTMNSLSERYNSAQTGLLSPLPAGHIKDFVTGVSNIPEIALQTAGAIPYGLEAIARNPTSISDSVSFGVGSMGGYIYQKGTTHPAELAGELIGSYGLAKGIGRAAPTIGRAATIPSLKNFAVNDRASFSLVKSRSPNLIFETRTAVEPKTYIVAGDKIVQEGSFKINSIKLDPSFTLTPEMEKVLYGNGKPTAAEVVKTEKLKTFENNLPAETSMKISSIVPGKEVKLTAEMEETLYGKKSKKEQQYVISSAKMEDIKINPEIKEQQYVISSAKIGDGMEITPDMEKVLFTKSRAKETFNPEKLNQKLERNIFSPELTKPTRGYISNIKMEASIPSFPAAASLSPALAYNLPDTLNQGTKTIINPVTDPFTKTITNPVTDPLNNPVTDPFTKGIPNPGIDPLPNPGIDPLPNPGIDPLPNPGIDPLPNPGIDPIISNFFIENVIDKSIFSGGDFDFKPGKESTSSRRKSKNRKLKNQYGDPFKLKL